MKPIKLTMRAFGSYGGEQVLDFRKLEKRSFFLIHGPTGSGKTTILDAICFALYGETSGEERASKQMRSAHAQPAVLTEVIFDFALGNEVYRVRRVPEQEKSNQKKGGSQAVRTQATLWRRTGLSDDFAEGMTLAQKTNEVTDKIESLLGFKSKQFRQVVLLPQGRFRQLLLSGSQEKEVVLEALFKTEVYKRIEESLKLRKRDLASNLEQKGAVSKMILEQAGAESMDALIKERETLSAAVAESVQKLANVRSAYHFAQKELDEGLKAKAKLDELFQADQAFSLLGKRTSEFGVKRTRLEEARQASLLAEREEMLLARLGEKVKAEERARDAESKLAGDKEEAEACRLAFAVEEERAHLREEASKKCVYLEEISLKARELVLAGKASDEAKMRYLALSGQLEKLKERLGREQRTIGEYQNLLIELEKKAAGLALYQKEFQDYKRAYEKRESLDKVTKELAIAHEDQEIGKQSLESLAKHCQAQKEALYGLETALQNGQASLLAQSLKEGEDCPVCGSKEHPRPAQALADLPGEAMIKAKKEEIKVIEEQLRKLQVDELEQAKLISRLRAELDASRESLGEMAGLGLEEIKEKARQAKENANLAEGAGGKALKLRQELVLLQAKVESAANTFADLQRQAQEALALQESKIAVYNERAASVPEGLRDQSLLEQAKVEAARHFDSLKKAYELAQSRLSQARQNLASAQTSFGEAVETLAAAVDKASGSERDFAERLVKAGFACREDFQKAKLADHLLKGLEAEVQSFDTDFKAAEERLRRAQEATLSVSAPDLEALAAVAQKGQALLEETIREKAEFEQKLSFLDKQIVELAQVNDETRQLEASYATLGRLADVASGDNQFGVTLQRYVLASLLDDVLVFASARLAVMSRGRYVMRRAKERTDARKTGGLDLEIDDAYTGTSRPVSTLSGGESFLASLSLALGLADVVQSYAGGIFLETIFIDEGFGSLDPESLDLAIRALMDLQKGGRLVGIISHVPELKERIDARLEVVPGRSGSKAFFALS